MTDSKPSKVSDVLSAIADGDASASSKLLPLLYNELRVLARALMKKLPPGQTLEPTALVHEAYLRLVRKSEDDWEGRRHFFGAAARALRDILVEQARRKAAEKHGGGRDRYDLQERDLQIEGPAEDLLALNEALEQLEKDDPRKAEIVQLRFFAGLSISETAVVIGVSEATVKRDWRYLRAWLRGKLADVSSKGRNSHA